MYTLNLRIFATTLTILVLVGCGSGGGTTDSTQDTVGQAIPSASAPTLTQTQIQSYLKAINDARSVSRFCGATYYAAVPPLTWNNKLYVAAYEHSYDMAMSHTFAHNGSGTQYDKTAQQLGISPQGSTVQQRIENNGYFPWQAYGENLVAGFLNQNANTPIDTAQKAVSEWLNSPPHCADLMSPLFTEVGMAYVYNSADPTYKHYWTQDFGSP